MSQISPEDVTAALRRMTTKTAGRLNEVEFDESAPMWSGTPQGRQRLDHYVGSHYNPGPDDDPEGWDEDGWQDEYAGPLCREVQKKLDEEFGKGKLDVNIGEKGHVHVYWGSV